LRLVKTQGLASLQKIKQNQNDYENNHNPPVIGTCNHGCCPNRTTGTIFDG
jgi:hypothetical protein